VNTLLNGEQDSESLALSLLYPEQLYQSLEGDNATWWHFDPRVEWLCNYLLAHRQDKVVIICSKTATAIQLEQVLREREAIHAVLFHEGLSLMERDRAAAWFASAEEGAQVLLCSEIGSEGRNFQFAHQLIMFDLPFNPDLLEQRIGRLDRIGQSQDIQIIVPWLEESAQAILLLWYDQALNAFEHTCPGGRAVYDEVYPRLLHYLAHPTQQEGLDEFIQLCHTRHQQLKQELEQGRDRLLEIHSSGGEFAQNLVESIAAQDNDIALISFALNLFDIIGINQEDHSDNMQILIPSDQMLVPDFPGIPQDGCTITFDREQALSREDAQFITWEHPIIRNGLDLLASGTIGSCAVALLKNKQLPVGTFLLELVYVVEAQAPRQLQLTRFLPPTPVRLLLDSKGNNLAAQVSFDQLDRQLKTINRHNGSKLAKALQHEITALLQATEPQIAEQAQELIAAATAQAQEELSRELSRLEALRAVNPAIRDDELEALARHRQEVASCLQQASWRLDALRLIVVSHQ
ncbi:MAG: RNA polymerase-associated protein RapA, partial [Enterobacteriaceae bacterium]